MIDPGSVIHCTPEKYANFLSSLVFLLIFGFAWGHISQSPKKLLRILNKMYAYIILPALALISPISIKVAMPLWTNSISNSTSNSTSHSIVDNPVVKILLIDFIVKSSLWIVVVLGFWAAFRDRKILKAAGLTAQFIIHGNDIGFSKALLEVSCRWINPQHKHHYDKVTFTPIEVPTNTMCFLIFLPLTNGLVGMTAQSRPTVKGFLQNVSKQMGKFGLSYVCLIIGIVIAATSSSAVTEKLSSFEDMVTMLETLLTLMCGVYIYYLTMNCNWGDLSISKTLALTAAVTLIYPILHYVIYICWTKEEYLHDHEFVILGHASTPSSIYVQIYILKHLRCPTNYIAAFLLTTVFGGLLMYAFVIVKELFITYSTKHISPVDFYVSKDQWEFELTSALLLVVFAMLIYARLHQTSVLRKLIFVTLLVELIANVVSMFSLLVNINDQKRILFPMVLSAATMVDHIGQTALIAVLFLYKYYPFVRRKWKALISSILLAAICIPTIIYTGTYFYFKNKSVSYNYKSIYFFLDLRSKNDTSDINISQPIGVISYTIINAIAVSIYIAALFVARYSRVRSVDNEDLIENIDDSEDKEKYTACKVLFSYQFCIIVLGIAFGIRNIHYTKSMQQRNLRWADYTLEFLELSSLIFADLAGAVMTLIFCISPGNMENEIKRFLYIPRKIKASLSRCTEDMDNSLDITNLPLGDLDRCRRFVLYHKAAFTAHYPPTVRDNKAIFEGRSLVAFLVQTGVADSPGEAVNLADSYLRGRVIIEEDHRHPFRRGMLTFAGDSMGYTLVPDDEIPDFSELLQNRAIQERPFSYLDYD